MKANINEMKKDGRFYTKKGYVYTNIPSYGEFEMGKLASTMEIPIENLNRAISYWEHLNDMEKNHICRKYFDIYSNLIKVLRKDGPGTENWFLADILGKIAPSRYNTQLLKKTRIEAGLTQKDFAEQYNIPLDTVKSWDSGRRKINPVLANYYISLLKGEEAH